MSTNKWCGSAVGKDAGYSGNLYNVQGELARLLSESNQSQWRRLPAIVLAWLHPSSLDHQFAGVAVPGECPEGMLL